MLLRSILSLCLVLAACGVNKGHSKKEPNTDSRIDDLRAKYLEKLAAAEKIRDAETGWLSRNDCDGMIWAGKYAASQGVTGVNILAAEYPGQPGKFGRRPAPWCWTPEDGDQGSKTEWSRDMAVAGLLPYAWSTGQRDILERHAAYGKKNSWQMGEPLEDGRVVYTPALVGSLYKAIYAMGGELDANAIWPNIYPEGLVDYQAHLQVMSIWLQGEVAAVLGDKEKPEKGASLNVSDTMYQRLSEHAARQPSCALYQVVYGLYSGDMTLAFDDLLGDSQCDYIRCDDGQCREADWLFSASLLLKSYPET